MRLHEFKELTLRQMIYLDEKLQAEEMVVSEETLNDINCYFGLKGLTNQDLRSTRNSIVEYFESSVKKYCMNEDKTKWLDGAVELECELITKMSMVCAAIDKEEYGRGSLY